MGGEREGDLSLSCRAKKGLRPKREGFSGKKKKCEFNIFISWKGRGSENKKGKGKEEFLTCFFYMQERKTEGPTFLGKKKGGKGEGGESKTDLLTERG